MKSRNGSIRRRRTLAEMPFTVNSQNFLGWEDPSNSQRRHALRRKWRRRPYNGLLTRNSLTPELTLHSVLEACHPVARKADVGFATGNLGAGRQQNFSVCPVGSYFGVPFRHQRLAVQAYPGKCPINAFPHTGSGAE